MVDIILVRYNDQIFYNDCLTAIATHTDDVQYSLKVHGNYPRNYNLGMLWNMLIRESREPYICLLNTDTRVTKGWLDKMMEVFEKEDNVAVVGPSTTHSGNPQEIGISSEEYKLVDYTKEYSGGNLCGFCLLFPKWVWEKVGGFPEDFGFYGQEEAFLYKVTKAGYRQIWRKDAFVWHYGGGSAKLAEERGEIDIEKEKKLGRIKRDQVKEELFGKDTL